MHDVSYGGVIDLTFFIIEEAVVDLLLLNNKLKICAALWGKEVRLYAIILAYLAISHWGYLGILQKKIHYFVIPEHKA